MFSTGMAPEIYPQCILVVIMGLGVFIPFEHRFVEGGAKRLSKGRDKPLPRNTILTALLMIVIASQMPTLGALLTVILICLLAHNVGRTPADPDHCLYGDFHPLHLGLVQLCAEGAFRAWLALRLFRIGQFHGRNV